MLCEVRFPLAFPLGAAMVLSALWGTPCLAQTVVRGSKASAHARSTSPAEQNAARAFDAAKTLGAPELYAFLKPMPKGADLHMHLSGAVYAETFIGEAAQAGLCLAPPPPGCTAGTKTDTETQTPAARSAPPSTKSCPIPVLDPKLPPLPLSIVEPTAHAGGAASCGTGELPASAALESQPLYDAVVDSVSMRGYVPTPGHHGPRPVFRHVWAGRWPESLYSPLAGRGRHSRSRAE